MNDRKRDWQLIYSLKCASLHLERAARLHEDEGSVYRVMKEIEAMREDVKVAMRHARKLDKLEHVEKKVNDVQGGHKP